MCLTMTKPDAIGNYFVVICSKSTQMVFLAAKKRMIVRMCPAVSATQSLQTVSGNHCDDEEKRPVCREHQIGGGGSYSHQSQSVRTEIPFTDLRARDTQVLGDQQPWIPGSATAKPDSAVTDDNQPVVAIHSRCSVSRLKEALQTELYFGSGCERLDRKVAPKKLIKQAVDRFFKTTDLDDVRPDHSVNRASPLLNEFTKSGAGEWLHRKAVAANLVQLEWFVRIAGVNINHQCAKTGNTPLLIAVLHHHWEIAGSLLKAGASPTIRNHHGNHLVVMLFQNWLKQRLPAAVHISLIIDMLSTQSQQILKRDLLVPMGAFTFSMSAYFGHLSLCRAILQAFPELADIFRRDQVVEKTLMSVVSGSAYVSDVPALLRIIRYLITLENQEGNRLVDFTAKTLEGETFLIKAVLQGNYSIVAELLDEPGICHTINDQTLSGQSAYSFAHQAKKVDIMRLLDRKGAVAHKVPKSSGRRDREAQGRGLRGLGCYS